MDKRCFHPHSPYPHGDSPALIARESLRPLAVRYGLSLSAPSKHTKHLRRALASAADEAQQAHQGTLLDKLDPFEARLDRIFRKAEDLHSLHVSLGCVQEGLCIFALREKLRQSQPGNF